MKISAAPPLHGEVPKTCKKTAGTKAGIHMQSGTMADNHSGSMARNHSLVY